MRKKNFAFVCETGKDIGYGHLYRSIAIAESFVSNGVNITFYCNEDTVKPFINKKLNGINIYKWDLINKRLALNDLIIFDVYKYSFVKFKDLINDLKLQGSSTATVIDSAFSNYPLNTDYTFKIGYQKYNEKLELITSEEQTYNWVYSGNDFLVFRKEFKRSKSFVVRPEASKILIAMGGSDPFKLTEFVFNTLKAYPNPLELTFLFGMGFGKNRFKKFETRSDSSKHSITLLQKVDNISEIMLSHDIAIINGGNTRFELASLGVPFLSIAINQIQRNISDNIADDGIGISLNEINKLNPTDLLNSVSYLANNLDVRTKMSDTMTTKINATSTVDKFTEVLDRKFNFRALKNSELYTAYNIHRSVVQDLLKKEIRQWLRPIDYSILIKRQAKNENYGLFLNNHLQVFLSLVERMDYREWTNDMPTHSTYWLNTVSADPGNNIKGIGKVAIQLAIEHLKNNGIYTIYLDCVVGNGFLINLYESLGFRILNQKKVDYKSGRFEVALMYKDLL